MDEVEKDRFRTLMRIYEKFSGCRVLAYCIMPNHYHLLLEVLPRPVGGLKDEELLHRLGALYPKGRVAEIAEELAKWRKQGGRKGAREVARIHDSFLSRMHDLSWFMAGMTQRFTLWFNKRHHRRGRLWDERFKSGIVESANEARVLAAYIDLIPVRAGMSAEPEGYRWSSYGEAVHSGRPAGI